MDKSINLTSEIEERLPSELVTFMRRVGGIAEGQGKSLYLVGGVVRDLLLKRSNLDLDLVVEGDATSLAEQLAEITQGKITVHRRFNTAKLRWGEWSVDLVTARSETYQKPGALPSVKPGLLVDDLLRRDFTINTMAVDLATGRYGQLIDLHGGRDDLDNRLIRVLHPASFVDDATRIWRALRYEQRLDFHLEAETLDLLKRDVPMLDTISGDRIRHELELILKEGFPEKALRRATELGVLSRLHPALKGDDWLAQKFGEARLSESKPAALYMALLAYRLTGEENEDFISRLRLPKLPTRILRDSNSLKGKLESLADVDLAPSRVFRLLKDYSATAIITNSIASDSAEAKEHIQTFLSKLRYIRPLLTGNDLKKLGVPPGPRIKEILERLHEARLDGKVRTKKEEEGMVGG